MQTPPRRRGRLLRWLLGDPAPQESAVLTPTAQSSTSPAPPDDERAALLGGVAVEPGPSDEVRAIIPREMFRVNVSLPANLDAADGKPVPIKITNISGTGAALLYDSSEPLAPTEKWLDLAMPNRPKALELEVQVVRSRRHTGPQGEDQQILHVNFPSIRRNEQDAIIAYINNLRLYEDKQFSVAAKVILEVVTGRRRFAKFNGETIDIRPDAMRLMMEDFDAIAGAEVMMTIMAPRFVDHLDVEDVKVEKVDIIDPRHAEVEVSLAKPDDQVLLFVRKYYPATAKAKR
jgi:PilZ domain